MLPLRSYWLALLLLSQEVCCPCILVDTASLADWRCSCLYSELTPSVTEKSVIFIKELSFPQTAPTDDAFFQSELGWSVWGSLGRTWIDGGLVCRLLDRRGWSRIAAVLVCRLWTWHSCAKTRKKGGRRGFACSRSDA